MTSQDINITINPTTFTVTVGEININLTASSIGTVAYVEADVPFYFNGANSDEYLVYNSTREKLELYVGGNIQADWG